MRRVKIVILIWENCLVTNDRFIGHSLCLDLKTVEKIRCPRKRTFKAARDESYLQLVYWEEKIDEYRKLYMAADVDESWEKVRRTRLSHKIKMINILCKQKLKSRRINRKARETPGEFVALVMVLTFLLVNKNMELIKNAHALYRDNGPLSSMLSS